MSYFGQKVRACLIHEADIEMTMLKLAIRRALEDGCAVSYKNKIYLIPPRCSGDNILITRLSEPDVAMEIPNNRTPDATDRFVDAFVFETGANIDEVMFHENADIDSGAVRWHWIKTGNESLSALITRTGKFYNALVSKK